jgi:hypothetical protein
MDHDGHKRLSSRLIVFFLGMKSSHADDDLFGPWATEDEVRPSSQPTSVVQLLGRGDGMSIYEHLNIIRPEPPSGVSPFPCIARLHDVLGDGNCAFRSMAVAL